MFAFVWTWCGLAIAHAIVGAAIADTTQTSVHGFGGFMRVWCQTLAFGVHDQKSAYLCSRMKRRIRFFAFNRTYLNYRYRYAETLKKVVDDLEVFYSIGLVSLLLFVSSRPAPVNVEL